MNPTDEVDDLLTRAGARWRADQPSAPEPDLDRIMGGRRRPRAWVPALAAASVAAIAAAALTVLPGGEQEPTAGPPSVAEGNATPQLAEAPADPANDQLLVRPGDKVQAGGEIIAAPGQDPVFCPSRPTNLVGYPPGQEPAPVCPAELAVTLKNVDLGRLGNVRTTKGVRTGTATLTGTWADRSIEVQEQKAFVPPQATPLPTLPCPPPTGGWVAKPSNLNSPAVLAFLDAHSDQIADPVVQHPRGHGRGKPVVVQIGVAHGDLAAFQTSFENVYHGNLCVSRALLSRGDTNRIYQKLTTLTGRKELGMLVTTASTPGGGPAEVGVVVYTEQVKAALAPVGLELLKINPAVKPLR
ncbi:hypothetical protein AB0H36_16745 [Kribbella sp. NPDC050820]|uniref:hypothetical protein n=1 Tax=Kribbella sp. NPDC050820 TaxID=3155408 RepID=UPI0033E29135